ncbi:rap guanine nucleotide exchange factor 2-like isoform X3 [Babylonia areolata]|uniref:rap guanine nucleotide exchange factor 2-like isoform X3 n=1 Tax=Babylonia areolata TaxID=304850 RepID=UPI003FD3EC16
MLFCVIGNDSQPLAATFTPSSYGVSDPPPHHPPHVHHHSTAYNFDRHTPLDSRRRHRRLCKTQRDPSSWLSSHMGCTSVDKGLNLLNSMPSSAVGGPRHPHSDISLSGGRGGLRDQQRSRSMGDLLTAAHTLVDMQDTQCGGHTHIHPDQEEEGWSSGKPGQERHAVCHVDDSGYPHYLHAEEVSDAAADDSDGVRNDDVMPEGDDCVDCDQRQHHQEHHLQVIGKGGSKSDVQAVGEESCTCIEHQCGSNSFGKRSQGCARRTSECLTLEPSEMIAIDYPDVQAQKGGPPHRNLNSANLDRLLAPELDLPHDLGGSMHRMNSDSGIEQLPLDGGAAAGLLIRDPYLRSEHLKRSSRASDTSSAYSGSDMMQSSLDDPDNPEAELSGLVESLVDSDDEEGYADSTESFPIRDAVRDCLEKDPSERMEDDIEILMDFMQHFRAFANMTQMTRRALCAVMVFAVVPHEGTVVMKDGEELDSWSVILNGEVEVVHLDSSRHRLQMGDSFGITPTMEKLYHKGVMQTMMDDCQFVCIAQQDYYRILHQGEENTRKHEEQGEVVMVTEHRELDGGNRRGHIVIRGTPERLMQHLVEDHSAIDPTYVEDLLLSYRTFLPSPLHLANHLLHWFDNPTYRPKVTRVVLFWVNNHFNDFETDPAMCEFLEHFECLLERESQTDFEHMMGQMSLLNMACAAKAKVRTVTLTRTTRDEILHFSILGGLERGHGIFITKVDKGSKAAEAGLKRGDQILEVNGKPFQQIYYNQALELLRGSTHLSISLKSNLQDFKEMLRSAEKNTPRKVKREENSLGHMAKQRLSVPDLDAVLSNITDDSTTTTVTKEKTERKGFFNFGSKPRFKKALEKMNIVPKMNGNATNHSDENLNAKASSRPSSTSSTSSNSAVFSQRSASNPDLSTLTLVDEKSEPPQYVVKVFRADQSFKFILIHKETTAKEVVMFTLQEFGVADNPGDFSLCEVTVESEMFIKQRRLPDQLSNLTERLNLNSRYYLKNKSQTEPLVPDHLIGELLKESQISLLQLQATEVAWQLTLQDFAVFCQIEPTEYIDDLFELDSVYGCPMIRKFAELVNREMFWVVTEICGEANVVKRMKLIKHFIKIAKCCKDYKNYNSMFAIMSGLRHGSVSRLRAAWEKLPSKYCKMFEDLETLMDPSRNMAKYRNLLNSEHIQPPVIPIFPVVKKDLTFIHLGNDSYVDGLVNFEKLRMIAKEIRHTANMASARYDVNNMTLSSQGLFGSGLASGMATLKRTKNRRSSFMPNPKKMYEEAQMARKVRSYLSNMPAITNEEELADMSNQCEPPARKREASPSVNNSPNLEDKRSQPTGPKFGTESPGAVRKIMALTDKVRPHNPKVPVPSVVSPATGRRGPPSPRHGPGPGPGPVQPPSHNRLLPVRLTHESSSVLGLGHNPPRKPIRTGSLGSMECSDSDSGHRSSSSSSFHPAHPAFPPSRQLASSIQHPHSSYQQSGHSVPQVRPPLPSYSVVMHNASLSNAPVSSHASFPGYPHIRRPPLPDYQSAAHMAHLARQKQKLGPQRTHSHDAIYPSRQQEGLGHCGEDAEEEQVSAV